MTKISSGAMVTGGYKREYRELRQLNVFLERCYGRWRNAKTPRGWYGVHFSFYSVRRNLFYLEAMKYQALNLMYWAKCPMPMPMQLRLPKVRQRRLCIASAFQTPLNHEPQGLPPDLDDYIGHSRLLRKYSLDLATDSQPLAQSKCFDWFYLPKPLAISDVYPDFPGDLLLPNSWNVKFVLGQDLRFCWLWQCDFRVYCLPASCWRPY